MAEVLQQQRFVRRFAVRSGVPAAFLDDFVQDVVLAAWLAIQAGRFDPPDPERPLDDSVRAWLAGIVKRKAMDLRKANRNRDRLIVPESDASTESGYAVIEQHTPEDRMLSRETLEVLGRVKLSPLSLAVVLLAAEGYTLVEIGQRLGIPMDTAWTCLRRARAKYRRAELSDC